jgi:beta-N-acetylhexosaminidase
MNYGVLFTSALLLVALSACSGNNKKEGSASVNEKSKTSWTLNDFYKSDQQLADYVDSIYHNLSASEKAAQMIMPATGKWGEPDSVIAGYIREKKIGSILLLNGTVGQFKDQIALFDKVNSSLPLIYSADGEPSLINRKIEGTPEVPKTSEITEVEECRKVAGTIAGALNDIGINYNFAPVCDLSTENAAIGNRSFGSNPDTAVMLASEYIKVMQQNGIVATAKHFPGHGLVNGDSHHNAVFIKGEFKELGVYPPLIDRGVVSIMVGHISVEDNEYDTDQLPSTLSKRIVSDLLKDSLDFQGITITDAMNMGAVKSIDNASWQAVLAGNDIILMPLNVDGLHGKIVKGLSGNTLLAGQLSESIKKVVRLKVCLGLL